MQFFTFGKPNYFALYLCRLTRQFGKPIEFCRAYSYVTLCSLNSSKGVLRSSPAPNRAIGSLETLVLVDSAQNSPNSMIENCQIVLNIGSSVKDGMRYLTARVISAEFCSGC